MSRAQGTHVRLMVRTKVLAWGADPLGVQGRTNEQWGVGLANRRCARYSEVLPTKVASNPKAPWGHRGGALCGPRRVKPAGRASGSVAPLFDPHAFRPPIPERPQA